MSAESEIADAALAWDGEPALDPGAPDYLEQLEARRTTDSFIRRGLGYVARYPSQQVVLTLDRVAQRGGELFGELSVNYAGRHLLHHRQNLSSAVARRTTARELAERVERSGVDWRELLEGFCQAVLQAERTAEPIVVIGGSRPRRAAIPYTLYPLLPQGRPTILFGEGNTGKSFIAALVAVSLSTGTEPLGGWTVADRRPVLVLDWEADADEWHDRVVRIAGGLGVTPPAIAYRPMAGALTDQLETVARDIADQGIGLVIVDSVGAASPSAREGVDANDGALRLFRGLRELGTTALLIDHVSKADADKTQGAMRPYGSIFKINLARSVWELRREGTPDPDVSDLALYHRKCNAGPTLATVGLRITYTPDVVRFERADVSPGLVAGATVSDQITLALSQGPLTPAELAEETGISPNSIRPKLHQGVKAGRYTRLPDGRYALVYHEAQ